MAQLKLEPMVFNGREVLPFIEGGKGVAVSNGHSAGAWAAAGGIGTFSGVNPDFYDDHGNHIPFIYKGKTRQDRHKELIAQSIRGGIAQAKLAHEISGGRGRLHMNVLWEMGGVEPILQGVLEKVAPLIHGITCGAGMPYRLAEICAQHNLLYYPIVSSARAFNILYRRAYHKYANFLGGVVYEDPWLAGGHNGLSSAEDPIKPQDPYPRVRDLRQIMVNLGLGLVPIIMAGGVWYLREWTSFLDNPEIGPVAFQFGTRPLMTQESPISAEWKRKLFNLSSGEIILHRFSPTGFYSSALKNAFLEELIQRSQHQTSYTDEPSDSHAHPFSLGAVGRQVYLSEEGWQLAQKWQGEGFKKALKTPDKTLIFITQDKMIEIRRDQVNCMGCLSHCAFSNWSDKDPLGTGKAPDPRSFCIQKTLQDIAHGQPVEENLAFAGHGAYHFAEDPFYQGGKFIPTVAQLIERLSTGD